jgi:putative transposase
MARLARVVVPGYPHHITQRGNRRLPTFFSDADYEAYLDLLAAQCAAHGVRLWAWCLMPNHVHLVAVPKTAEGLARAVGEAHRRYTRRINFREEWRGHLWQGRFASFVMDESHLLSAAAYVERNPVKAALVERAEDWPWSSAAAHACGRGDGVADGAWLAERIAGWTCSWGEYLRGSDEPGLAAAMRLHENTGRPLGPEAFVRKLQRALRRLLLPGKPGRSKKRKK